MPQLLHPTARLDHFELALDIRGNIGMRVDQRMSDAGLGGQMHDPVDLRPSREQRRKRAALGDVEALKDEARLTREFGEPRLLERDRVIGVEVVDADHRLASREQGQTGVEPDEAGGAGDEDGHASRV
jgi:hypothetical protein